MTYELYYWDGIQGRGEFVRLSLEEAGATYIDVSRDPDRGTEEMLRFIRGEMVGQAPFAPPFLKDGDQIISHVANILFHLGLRLGLAPDIEAVRTHLNGLQLTITDFVAEVHDTHHPIALSKYFEDQVSEAKARTTEFVRHRLPKFLGYFENILSKNQNSHIYVLGADLTYVDLSLFQLMEGLGYAFPRAMADHTERYPALTRLHAAVRDRPRIAAYLKSDRRLPFSENGIFRRYRELDIKP